MSIAKICLGLLLLGWLSMAQAQNRLLNVSVLGLASAEEPQVGCTIVNGYRELAVLAEAETSASDPYLQVRNLYDPNSPTLSNDNWGTLTTFQKQRLREGIGRLPKRSDDAAIVMSANNAAVCAYGFDKRAAVSARLISVQITDITSTGPKSTASESIDWLYDR